MPRAIWSGAISFGLVNVPVKLYSATSPKSVRFNQLHAADGGRLKQKRVCSIDGEEVPYDQIVKGYEVSPDRYVTVTQEELDALDTRATKTIDIEEFVDLVEIDPVYYESAYHVAPSTGGAKAYRLLLSAMEEAGKVAIARFVLRSRQQLCALRPADGVLTLSTMLYGDEVNSPERLDELEALGDVEANEREVAMARQLIESLAAPFEPGKFRDAYRERVLELIERKAAGEEIAIQPAAEEPAEVPDLMAALEASLQTVRGEGDTAAPAAAAPRRRARRAPARARAKARAAK
ncbi:Ku protein [Conexibacter sp. JD483]|uniref:non-homologous end joining protein Ku n=1 Tax=unclassified Conexibacter TaxID=2627773 RepID=UPI00271AE6CA|nr:MULTISPECIES: Ku protein [unclassified Conexibacter]MDO8188870.1 Ku protein [Conexibacter sp. CPCC 205706]MDO8200448.1 Ku protein [Conexibacter sp. CPCC 205762]MDR9372593.1 Ku protein [Conexibacter sp. JD483]